MTRSRKIPVTFHHRTRLMTAREAQALKMLENPRLRVNGVLWKDSWDLRDAVLRRLSLLP
jgi:hypothetical protein